MLRDEAWLEMQAMRGESWKAVLLAWAPYLYLISWLPWEEQIFFTVFILQTMSALEAGNH